ncbi:MAG: 50S ribosomal protein L32 [Patescibacteria group bacterium]|jgi:large subunit ribosomal protein L32
MVQMKRHTRHSTLSRRAHHALKKVKTNSCAKCGKAILPHHACSFCGTYRGRAVKKIKTAKPKKKS